MRGSRNFRQGGGPGHSDKKSSDNAFFSRQLILLKSNGSFRRKLSFFKVPEGVQLFSGGPTFTKGVQLLIPYRNPYNLSFSRGGGGVWTPCPPSGSALDSPETCPSRLRCELCL